MVTTWDERIATALVDGAFPDTVKKSAGRWGACPVAERLSAVERQWVAILPLRHSPVATRWQELGIAFNLAVQSDDPREAKRLLDKMRELPTP